MKDSRTLIRSINARALDMPLRESFEIARGAQSTAANVLVTARLADGAVGYGECAPFPAFNGETQKGTLAAVRAQARRLCGADAARAGALARELAPRLRRRRAARAGIEMAVVDAWSRSARFPLRVLFGGAQDRVATDVTIPILPPAAAARAAAWIARFGVRTLKIKVGKDAAADAERIAAAMIPNPKARLILDGNAGMTVREALRLLCLLRKHGIKTTLFEQPVKDLAGLREVSIRGRVDVAADESASSLADVLGLIRARAVQVVNIKLMKTGLFESLDIARVARAAGLDLMIGGLIESRLAMTCAAHLAAGLGDFKYVDLDMPLFLAAEPMRGVPLRRGGVYDLEPVRAGIGVRPK